MNIFAIIANLINKILSFSLFPSVSIPEVSLPGEIEKRVTRPDQGDFATDPRKPATNRCLITKPENVNPNARFHSTGSPAWVNQWAGTDMAGQHGGTDYLAPFDAPVYAPFAMTVTAIGHYSDSGRMGDYFVAKPSFDGSLEYYSGHLTKVRDHITEGQEVACGQQVGNINIYNHTHIQIKRNGQIIDPESILT